MNTFGEWASDFLIRFNGFSKIIDQSEELQKEFEDIFGDFSLDTLKKATRELMLLDPQPFPNEVIAKLHSRCRSISFAPRSHDKPDNPWEGTRYKCLDCRDGGTLQVYHPIGYSPIRNDCFEISKHLNLITVACTCEAGEQQQQERRYKTGGFERVVEGLKKFNSRTMKVITKVRTSDQVYELTEFVLSGQAQFSGFEDYQ